MATIVTRAGKGSALTHNEADANFVNLNNAKYEAGNSADLGASTVSANTTTDAFRITQTGTGNAFVVEDSASPDATPFVIDANGDVIVGSTASILGGRLQVYSPNPLSAVRYGSANPPSITLASTTASIGNNVLTSLGAILGRYVFAGDDGTNFIQAARIDGAVDGTPATNDMPGRLVFSTTPSGSAAPVERMRIGNAGNVGIGGFSGAVNVAISKNITGASSAFGVLAQLTVSSDVTASAIIFRSRISTQAAAFTLPNLIHFDAAQNIIGADSTVTNQFGFNVNASLTGATNNFGVRSDIAAGTGRFNFYANGTADNFFSGKVRLSFAGTVNNLENATIIAASAGTAGHDVSLIRYNTGPTGPRIYFGKSNTASLGVDARVSNGDTLGTLDFRGNDGSTFASAAQIVSVVDGTSATNSMPGRLVFSTTPSGSATPVERMRITNTGNVGIGTTTPDASALLDVQSTTKGVRMPNMTTTQKNAIASPAVGLIVFDTTLGKLSVRTASAWETITSV